MGKIHSLGKIHSSFISGNTAEVTVSEFADVCPIVKTPFCHRHFV